MNRFAPEIFALVPSTERLAVLKGHKTIAFPDIDGYQEWTDKLSTLGITVSPILQQNATPQDREAHIDIADWLIRYLVSPPPPDIKQHSRAFLLASRYIAPDRHAELEALITDLDLEYLGAEKDTI